MKLTNKSIFYLTIILIILIGFLIINENITTNIYNFTFSKVYILSIFLLLASALIVVLFKERLKIAQKEKILGLFSYVIFLPFVFYPVFRCYFKIPYIFCHVCPRKCIFGHLRPYTIPAVLLLNLEKRTWCYKYCPIGKLQDKQQSITAKKIVLPKFLSYTKYLFLLFIIVSYFIIKNKDSIFYNYFFKNIFSVSIIVLIIAAILFTISFFIHRFWCNYFCPIGSFGDLILKINEKI